MSRQHKNLCWLAATRLLETAIGFCVGLAVARHVGATQFGGLALCLLIVGIVQRIVQSGLWAPITRRANDPDGYAWELAGRHVLAQRSWGWFLVLLLGCLLPIPFRLELFLTALALPGNTGEARSWTQTARFESKKTLIADRSAQIVAGVFQIALIHWQAPVAWFALGMPVLAWTRHLILLNTPTEGGKETHSKEEIGGRMAAIHQEARGTRLAVVLQHLNQNLPILISGLIQPTAAGLVAAASKIQNLAGTPATLVQHNNCPQIVQSGAWKRTLAITLILSGIPAIVVIAAAHPIVNLLYGTGFAEAAHPLRWMAAAIPAIGILVIAESAILYHRAKQPSPELSLHKPAILGTIAGLTTAGLWAAWSLNGSKNPTTVVATAAGIFLAVQSWNQAMMLLRNLISVEKTRKTHPQCPSNPQQKTSTKPTPRAGFLR